MDNLKETMYCYRYERESSKPKEACSECGYKINKWEDYYKIDSKTICEECIINYIQDHKKIKGET